MNYRKIYENLINRSKNRVLEDYTEKHHIVPKCMGGSDEQENLVNLTPEEHYVAHQLLVKIYPDNDSLIYAACMMVPNRPNNKLYGWLRRKLSKTRSRQQTGKTNSNFGSIWITDGLINRKIKGEIPNGWKRGRFIPKMRLDFDLKCSHCGKQFKCKRKRKMCSAFCLQESRPDIVKDNFAALRREYEANGHVISKAFIACGIGFNNNTFARFRKLLCRVGSVATAPLL